MPGDVPNGDHRAWIIRIAVAFLILAFVGINKYGNLITRKNTSASVGFGNHVFKTVYFYCCFGNIKE